jgi:hypothetical protein
MTDLLTLAARLNITATTAALESFAAAVRSEALVTACETIRKLAAQVDPPRPAPLQARDALVTVVAAAVRNDDNIVHSLPPPATHERIIADMVRHGRPPGEDAVRGFLLSDGRFVLPDRAGEIAVEAGQVERLSAPPYLYPQDLWARHT